jgi:hypothetical protein
MAVLIQFEWPGLTKDEFEKARRLIDWEGNPAKGSIVQAQGWDNGVFKAADIWESEEDWNNFLQNRIMPAVAGLNVPGEPTIRVFEAHLVFAPGLRQTVLN